jgi:hypothetical protein
MNILTEKLLLISRMIKMKWRKWITLLILIILRKIILDVA